MGIEPDPNGPLHRDVKQFFDGLDGFKKAWEDGVDAGFNCQRLRDPVVAAASPSGS